LYLFRYQKDISLKSHTNMNVKRFIISVLAVFITVYIIDLVFHGFLFESLYTSTSDMWRGEDDFMMAPMVLSQFGFSLILSYIYIKNYENRGLEEGLRFGLYFGLLLSVIEIGKFSYLPVPFEIIEAWILVDMVKCLICGVILSLLYKN